jgi:hypothetical protein
VHIVRMLARGRVGRWLPVAVVAAVGCAYAWQVWQRPVVWSSDAGLYQAQSLELRGVDARLARRQVFQGAGGHERLVVGHSERWVEYDARFARRRWLVPALAAAVEPVLGLRSLLAVSLLGYVLAGLAVYALVRLRARRWVSAAVAVGCLLFEPVRIWASFPLTDSFGIATLAFSLWALARARAGGLGFAALWVGSVAAAALARDTTVIIVCAACWLAVTERTRCSALLASAAIAVAAVPMLLFRAPLREQLAFVFTQNTIPVSDSWAFIRSAYWPNMQLMLSHDLLDLFTRRSGAVVLLLLVVLALRPVTPSLARLRRAVLVAGPLCGAAVLVDQAFDHGRLIAIGLPPGTLLFCAPLLLLLPGGRDPFLPVMRAGMLATFAYLALLPNYTAFRLELVLLPFAAFGIGHAVARTRGGSGRKTPKSPCVLENTRAFGGQSVGVGSG